MTIEEMLEAKKQAEATIREAVQKFVADTGMMVADIHVGFIDYNPVGVPYQVRRVSSVTLDVRL